MLMMILEFFQSSAYKKNNRMLYVYFVIKIKTMKRQNIYCNIMKYKRKLQIYNNQNNV